MILSAAAFASAFKVDTFSTNSATLSACEDAFGSGVSTFDLTSAQDEVVVILPNMGFRWFEDAGMTSLIADPTSYLSTSKSVFVEVFSTIDGTCTTTQEVFLSVTSIPDLSYLDAIGDTICGRRPFQFGMSQGPDAIYDWEPNELLDSDTLSNPIFTPDAREDYSYTVTVTSRDGLCQTMRTIEFKVLDADLDITYLGESTDTVELCKDQLLVTLAATTSGDPAEIMWSASRDTLSSLTGPTTSFDADFSTFVYASQTFDNGCILHDTVLVRVDSLPEFEISVIPALECAKYCPGVTVTMVTNAPDLACYPDVEYLWTPRGDIVGADTNLNVALQLSNGATQLYTRTTTNHACIEVDTHTIFVVDTIPILLGVPAKVCPGDQFEVYIDTAYLPGFTDYTWMLQGMGASLNCDDCPNTPRVTVSVDGSATGSFMISVMGIKDGCCTASGVANFSITTIPIPLNDTMICGVDDVQFFGLPELTGYNWMSSNGGSFDNDQAVNPILSDIPVGGTVVQVTAMDADGCPAQGSATVSPIPVVIPIINLVTVCPGDDAPLSVASDYVSYTWTSNQVSFDDPNSATPTALDIPIGGATVMVQVVDENGCIINSENRRINTPAEDNLTLFTVEPDSNRVDFPIETDVTVEGFVNPAANTHNWTLNGSPLSETSELVTLTLQAGENILCDTITNSGGCAEGDCLVLIGQLPNVFIPNVFMPSDNNEKNRRFQPLDDTELRDPIPAEFIEDFKVWNRWGQKVYDNDSNETGWNGRQGGDEAPSDVYVYIIKIALPETGSRTFTGDVTLIR